MKHQDEDYHKERLASPKSPRLRTPSKLQAGTIQARQSPFPRLLRRIPFRFRISQSVICGTIARRGADSVPHDCDFTMSDGRN